MPSRTTQVDAQWYRRSYMTLPRMITHWHQANSVAEHSGQYANVLEIGPGSGHTTWLLRNWGMKVTTLDFDRSLAPDIVADVTAIPCIDGAFDCVLAAEVLEHIPFAEFSSALAELRRVSRGHVIITLPAPFAGLSILANAPRMNPKGLFLGIPYWLPHYFNGEHYWELGKQGFSAWRIRRLIKRQGFSIVSEFRPAPSLYCYFFVLRANNQG